MPAKNDVVYTIARIDHDGVSPDSIIQTITEAVRELEADAERRGFALNWNESTVTASSIQFGANPPHEVRVTAFVL